MKTIQRAEQTQKYISEQYIKVSDSAKQHNQKYKNYKNHNEVKNEELP